MEKLRGRALNIALGVWAVLVFAFLFIPIVYVIAHSFSGARSFLIWGGFSTEPYSAMLDNEQLKETVVNSFKAAIGSTLISIVIGTLAGIALARRPGKWTVAFMAIVLLILTTPEIVDAIGLQLWFVRIGSPPEFLDEIGLQGAFERIGSAFREGMLPLWVGQSIFSSAVVTLIVRARMAGLDDSLEQAAADLYATPFNAFRQITLPLVAPAILAGGLLAFTFSLDNVVITQFVSSADTTTFPVYVFGLTRAVMKPEVGAMSTVLIGFTLLALVLVALVLRRTGDDTSKIAATLTGN